MKASIAASRKRSVRSSPRLQSSTSGRGRNGACVRRDAGVGGAMVLDMAGRALLRGPVAAVGGACIRIQRVGRAGERESGGGVVRAQRAVGAQEPFARLRLELRTGIHRRLVDMQRDRDLVVAGVGDGVVLVRRDQAAGAAGA